MQIKGKKEMRPERVPKAWARTAGDILFLMEESQLGA